MGAFYMARYEARPAARLAVGLRCLDADSQDIAVIGEWDGRAAKRAAVCTQIPSWPGSAALSVVMAPRRRAPSETGFYRYVWSEVVWALVSVVFVVMMLAASPTCALSRNTQSAVGPMIGRFGLSVRTR